MVWALVEYFAMIIDTQILDKVSAEDKASPRFMINYYFHQSHDDLCHRMLNAVEPGTDIPIHRHPTKDESFVVLRGKVRSTIYNDDGSVIESVVLCAEEGRYGADIPKGSGTNWKAWRAGVWCLNAKKGRLCRMR